MIWKLILASILFGSLSCASNELTSHHDVYVLLYNAGSSYEGIHTIKKEFYDTVLMFESYDEARRFAKQLGHNNFPIPTVEMMSRNNILEYCRKSQHTCEFVPTGIKLKPSKDHVPAQERDYQAPNTL